MNFQAFQKKYQKVPIEVYPNNISSTPIVSVCVQTYNHGECITDCLEGILMQETDFPFEILLGEDDSTDETREICKEYAEKYPGIIRLFLHKRENNIQIGGQPTGRYNFIYNLFNACGKYIALCEGDDYWTDSLKLQKQVEFMEGNDTYSGCYTNFTIVNGNGEIIKKDGLPHAKQRTLDKRLILEHQTPKTLTTLFRTWAVPRYFPELLCQIINGDTVLFSLISNHGPIKYLNFNSGRYRKHKGGLWSSNNSMESLAIQIKSFSAMKNYFTGKDEIRILRKRIFKKKSKLLYLKIKYKILW
ncbi:MAG: glycosyltransferase [Balneolaceae bacterium]